MRQNIKHKLGQFALQVLIVFVVYALPLFLPLGLRAWPEAWIFLALWFGFWGILLLWLSRYNPSLFNERMRVNAVDQKGWDRLYSFLINAALFAWLLLIAFDAARWHLSPVPGWLQVGGMVVLLGSFYVLYATFRENAYLSPVVRLQEERGQTVISSGPYHYVRHPMYAGMILVEVGAPLVLGAWLGVVVGVLFIVILARRAVLEEQTLRQELPGYTRYMEQVKYRLIPYVW